MDIIWSNDKNENFIQLSDVELDKSLHNVLKRHHVSLPHKLEYFNEIMNNANDYIYWIYWRKYGVFFTDVECCHEVTLGMLYEYKNRPVRKPDISDDDYEYEWYTCDEPYSCSDKFLVETVGTAFCSSAFFGGGAHVGKKGNLSKGEIDFFGDIKYLK